jgi:hypothetical protein
MKVCRVKIRVEPEAEYWKRQRRRRERANKAIEAGKYPRLAGTELVFASLTEMARAVTAPPPCASRRRPHTAISRTCSPM